MATSNPARLAESDQHLIEAIMYLATLASTPKVIEPLLNTVRSVTAKVQLGEKLDAGDRKRLDHVRFQLQDHLLHRDPVRHFTPEELESKLAEHFGTSSS